MSTKAARRRASGPGPARQASGRGAAGRVAAPKERFVRLLEAEVKRSLRDISAEEARALLPQVPAIGSRLRLIMAEVADAQARPSNVLVGEGVRAADDSERRDRDAALERARRRGDRAVAEILAGPEMLTGEAFAARLNTTRETVNRWRRTHRVLGLEGNTRGVRYPAWQIDERGFVVKGLPELLEAARFPWTAYRLLTGELLEFDGMTGLEILKQGRADELAEVAAHRSETFY
jgi:hypothetical protein